MKKENIDHLLQTDLSENNQPATPASSDVWEEAEVWRELVAKVLSWAWANQPDTDSATFISDLKQNYSLTKK